MQISQFPSIHPSGEPTMLNKKRKITEATSCGSSSTKKRMVRIVGRDNHSCSNDSTVDPHVSLLSMLQTQGINASNVSEDKANAFFDDVISQAEVSAYDADVLKAIRDSDLETLQKFHLAGRPLKCSNRFGESLLHLACRKSLSKVVQFLVYEAKVPLNVRDDMGRSPLHDAFWSPTVNTELVDLIVTKCPDLLLLADKRGHNPLNYARKHHWAEWNQYLESRKDMICPKILDLPIFKSS